MDAYTSFASVYDTFMDNVPYGEWTEYIVEMLKEYGIEEGLILDLGCGTGTMTELLAQAGYDMIGVDNSEEMLELAMEKKAESGHDILYLLQDMREFELYGTVRAIVSVCDSMNYIAEEEELREVFRLVNNYLDPKGIFLFDFNTVHKYRDVLGNQTIAEDREDCSFIWENYYYEEEQMNEYELSLFIREHESDLYRKYQETHYQKAYELETMKRLLCEAGLEFVAAYDAFTREAPTAESERICVIAREHGKDIDMEDYIVRATAANGQVRAFAATTRNVVETARQRHNTSPVVTAALGRLLTAGAMMGSMMKNKEDLLTIQIKCDGPIGGLTVTADVAGNVKGYAENTGVCLPPSKKGKLDVAGALGLGVLSVIKDMGLKEPYIGQTILTTSEIAEDLTYYFATSEQVPSSVGLGVLMEKDNTVKRAGGFIIQVMPFVDDAVVDKLEENIKNLEPVTTMLDQGKSPEDILRTVLDGMDVEVTDTMPTAFSCNCSKERVEKALISIGKKEIREMIGEGKPVEMHCHFCNTSYEFSVDELKKLV